MGRPQPPGGMAYLVHKHVPKSPVGTYTGPAIRHNTKFMLHAIPYNPVCRGKNRLLCACRSARCWNIPPHYGRSRGCRPCQTSSRLADTALQPPNPDQYTCHTPLDSSQARSLSTTPMQNSKSIRKLARRTVTYGQSSPGRPSNRVHTRTDVLGNRHAHCTHR